MLPWMRAPSCCATQAQTCSPRPSAPSAQPCTAWWRRATCSAGAAADAAQQLADSRLLPLLVRELSSTASKLDAHQGQLLSTRGNPRLEAICCGLLEWVYALTCIWPSGGILVAAPAGPALVLQALLVMLGALQLASSEQHGQPLELCLQLVSITSAGCARAQRAGWR